MNRVKQPSQRYMGRNGFVESLVILPNNPSEVDAAEARDFAHFVLEELGNTLPPMDDMKSAIDSPETPSSIKEHISRLNAEYDSALEKLQDRFYNDLEVRVHDRYVQTDDLFYVGEHANDPDFVRLKNYIEVMSRNDLQIARMRHNDIVEQVRHERLRELITLHKKRINLERTEDDARVNRETQFPMSITDYRNMVSRPAQLHVARFLTSDADGRERIRISSRWTREETESLTQVYNNNDTFQIEVKKFVQENATKDPRSRHI